MHRCRGPPRRARAVSSRHENRSSAPWRAALNDETPTARPSLCYPAGALRLSGQARRSRQEMSDEARRPAVPLHRGAGRRDRDRLAGPVGERGHVQRAQPGRAAVRGLRPGRDPRRSPTSWTCSRTRPAPGCTSGTRWATSAPTSTRATGGWAATTSCTRWASTRSACPPSSTRSRPASTRGSPPTPTSRSSWRQLRRLGLGHDERRRFATTDPAYYRWTQWIFLQIFNSWYDTALDKARPIAELIAELDAGDPRSRTPGTNPFGRAWAELGDVEQRQVVDNHRLAYRSDSTVNWARVWAPCCPTRRSPPTGAASAATSRCSASR